MCSEASDGGVVAYYQSEFDVHVSQQGLLDEAMEQEQEQQAEAQQGRQSRIMLRPNNPLSVSSVVSRGQSCTRIHLTPPPGHCVALTSCFCFFFHSVLTAVDPRTTRDSASGRNHTTQPSSRLLMLFLIRMFFFPALSKEVLQHSRQQGGHGPVSGLPRLLLPAQR